MALGAVTVVEKGVLAPGGLRFAIVTVVPSAGANYTANGEALAVSELGGKIKEVLFVVSSPADEASGASDVYYDAENELLIAFDAATGVEEAGNQDLSAQTHTLFVVGR